MSAHASTLVCGGCGARVGHCPCCGQPLLLSAHSSRPLLRPPPAHQAAPPPAQVLSSFLRKRSEMSSPEDADASEAAAAAADIRLALRTYLAETPTLLSAMGEASAFDLFCLHRRRSSSSTLGMSAAESAFTDARAWLAATDAERAPFETVAERWAEERKWLRDREVEDQQQQHEEKKWIRLGAEATAAAGMGAHSAAAVQSSVIVAALPLPRVVAPHVTAAAASPTALADPGAAGADAVNAGSRNTATTTAVTTTATVSTGSKRARVVRPRTSFMVFRTAMKGRCSAAAAIAAWHALTPAEKAPYDREAAAQRTLLYLGDGPVVTESQPESSLVAPSEISQASPPAI